MVVTSTMKAESGVRWMGRWAGDIPHALMLWPHFFLYTYEGLYIRGQYEYMQVHHMEKGFYYATAMIEY